MLKKFLPEQSSKTSVKIGLIQKRYYDQYTLPFTKAKIKLDHHIAVSALEEVDTDDSLVLMQYTSLMPRGRVGGLIDPKMNIVG